MDKIYLKRLLLYFCIFHHCSFSIALEHFNVTPKPSELTCPIREAIFRSGYVKKCELLDYHSHLEQCTSNNIDECLCNAIDQTTNEICKLQITFDAKTFDFDHELRELQQKVKPSAFCNHTMNLTSNPTYQDRFQPANSFPIIVQLNELLRTKCSGICVGWDGTIKWFCSALVKVDELLIENLPRAKSTSRKSSIDHAKMITSLPAKDQADTSKQSETAKPGSEGSINEDKANVTTDERLKPDLKPPASKPAISSANESAKQKNDEQTQVSHRDDQRAGTIVGKPTKDNLGSNDLSEPPGPAPKTTDNSKSKKVLPVSQTAPTVSTAELLQPDNPPESVIDHEDEFDGEPDTELVRPDDDDNHLEKPISNVAEKVDSSRLKDDIVPPNPPIRNPIIDVQEESHLFVYFMALSLISIIAYIGFHNKHKIFAIVLEGKPSRGGRSRRRPNTAGYRKLDCNLEEAVTSQCNSNVTHVIY